MHKCKPTFSDGFKTFESLILDTQKHELIESRFKEVLDYASAMRMLMYKLELWGQHSNTTNNPKTCIAVLRSFWINYLLEGTLISWSLKW